MLSRSFVLYAICALSLSAQKKPITIESITQRSAGARADFGGSPVWAPDGTHFAYTKGRQIMLYDVTAKTEKELLALEALEKAAVPVPEAQRFDFQNRRVAESSYEWSRSGKELLLSVRGDLFLYHLESAKWDQLTATAEREHDPKLSPDGTRVAFRRGHDLYSLEIASKKLTRLTEDGSATLLNGELDWVYPEELDLGTAYWWSPDSKQVAYMQFDIAHEMSYPQVALGGTRAIVEPERFPQAGTPNAAVHVGVVPATGGVTRWMDLGDPRGVLISRVHWAPDSSKLAIERLNRVQNQMDLLFADAATGSAKTMIHESDPYWINQNDLFRFLSNGEFLWGSERDGFRHLYLFGPDGKQRKRLTEGKWEVSSIAGVDEAHQLVYFVSSEASPLERQLYSIKLSGKDRQRITAGAGTHGISMSPTSAFYLDTFSNLTQPPRRTLHTANGAEWAVYREADHRLTDEYDVLPTEIVTLKASDGTPLYARLIKPANYRAGEKYPAIVNIYGGPGVQVIHNAWPGAGFDQVMAHRGFVIWQLDNRGSYGRGHAFESPIYHHMGKTELSDQLEGVRYLTSQGLVDPARIGITGGSYGGYMTLYAMLNAPDVFKAGIADSPVTHWRNYDTIYTERYMGLPGENAEGYKASSPLEQADKLKGKLLIVHNFEDDNVLFQNTMQMAEALERAGKLFDMVIYPQKNHGVGGPFRKQLMEKETEFFEKNLK
ncbi:MAG TPA: DPP IV N-terminal domain-containing protein [Bryobacteraceae bacterium]|nr:DPP IV N-terminal domain-containing protein [Bryobacteraceae bacterium]